MAETKAAPPRKAAVKIQPKGIRTRKEAPRYDARAASRRFVRAMLWITAIGLFFSLGQTIRWYTHASQLGKIERELHAQFTSVLGEDVGNSPFGRLQFLHGQITAQQRFGIDPLALAAAFSRHADFMVRIDAVRTAGDQGRLEGIHTGDDQSFNEFVQSLASDEDYRFDLTATAETLAGVKFTIRAERR